MFAFHYSAFAQRYRLEQYVFQLPDIARPMVVRQLVHRRRRQARHGTTNLPAGLIEKVLHQPLQAVHALA
ncbi:hypothetical protein D3C81_1639400 [compost metagenome]